MKEKGCTDHIQKSNSFVKEFLQLGYKDSNLEMTESESVALPFGDSPIFSMLSRNNRYYIASLFKKQVLFSFFFNFFMRVNFSLLLSYLQCTKGQTPLPCNFVHFRRYPQSAYVQYASFVCLENGQNSYGRGRRVRRS